jgi:Spy/CpxP family protein refolding chaperone
MSNDKRGRLSALALAVVVLAVGLAAGIGADRAFRKPCLDGPDRHGPEEMMEHLKSDLDLSEAQARQITPIIEERWRRMDELFQQIDPQVEALHRTGDEAIRALLSPEQRTKFDERVERFRQRREAKRQRLEATRKAEPTKQATGAGNQASQPSP